MDTHRTGRRLHALTAAALLGAALACGAAGNQADQAKETQERLNAQTLAKPFEAADPQDIEAYLDNAVKQGIRPSLHPGSHWRRGYTCGNLLPLSYYEYRDCMLYYRYYRCYYCL